MSSEILKKSEFVKKNFNSLWQLDLGRKEGNYKNLHFLTIRRTF